MRKFIMKLFIFLWIIQEKKRKDVFNRTRTEKRLNPFNPLSYITIIILLLTALLMFGIIGMWKEIDYNDLKFKWK